MFIILRKKEQKKEQKPRKLMEPEIFLCQHLDQLAKLDESAATPLRRPTALNVFWEGQSPKNNISLFWSISHSSPNKRDRNRLVRIRQNNDPYLKVKNH